MRYLRIRLPSPALVIAVIALVVAVGGTSYAALTLPKGSVGAKQLKKNSVGKKQLKKNSVTSVKVKNGSLKSIDFGSGELPKGDKGDKGDRGTNGTNGTNGVNGSAVAFAHVNANGTLDSAKSKNITATSQVGAVPGYYCINVAVPVKNIVATIDGINSDSSVTATFGDPFTGCPVGTDVTVQTAFPTGTGTNLKFFIAFN